MKKTILCTFTSAAVLLSSGCCHRKPVPAADGVKNYVYIKVTEGPETYRYFLKDVSACEFEGKPYYCGIYAEPGWLKDRSMYINAQYITSMATFDSLPDFQEALKKSDD